jgi:RNA polymerase sigma factor (sigma-70 family)
MSRPESFDDVYRTYFPAAAELARSLTRDRAAADDIAAEGLLRIWPHWEAGVISQPRSYIRRTVVNEAISRSRRRAREQYATSRYRPAAGSAFEDAIGDRELVGQLLDQLPPRQRQILELRFLEDLSERETALRLGVSVGAVKSGTSRALARLRTSAGAHVMAA